VTPGPTYGTTTLNIRAPTAAAMLAPSDNPRFSGNSPNQNQMKQTPQTYAVTVTGTSGANQHTIQAAVTVQ